MAVKKFSTDSSIQNSFKLSRGATSVAKPDAPTIGTATAVTSTTATVAYTAATLGATGTTFTATSTPSSLTGTGASPITVSGLTVSTNYTFTVAASNANGSSIASAASNQITTTAPPTSYESIATFTWSTNTPTITLSLIPQTFKHLQVRAFTRDTRSATDINTFNMRFGTGGSIDSGANYSAHTMDSSGAGSLVGAAIANYNHHTFMLETGSTAAAGYFAVNIIDILDYTNTNKYKTSRALGGLDLSGLGNINLTSASWRNTAAIDTLEFFNNGNNNFAQYTQIALYGIKG